MLIPTIKKELLLLRRDPRVLVRLLVLPLAFIGIFGMVFNAQDKKTAHARPLAFWAEFLRNGRGVEELIRVEGHRPGQKLTPSLRWLA